MLQAAGVKDGVAFYDRDDVRALAQHLVRLSGVTIIDAPGGNAQRED